MEKILTTILIFCLFTGFLAFLLTLAKKTIGNYGRVKVTINEDKEIEMEGGDSLLSGLSDQKIFIPSACGGKGSCGYCKVKVESGGGDILPTELGYLTEEDRENGIRLSCQVKVKAPITISIPEELFNVKEFHPTVAAITDLTPNIKHLVFTFPQGEEITFKAGQYVQLKSPKYPGNAEEVFRAYSIASSPLDHHKLELIIGLVPGGICSTYVHKHLKEGDQVTMTGPYGDFYYQDSDRDILMVAAGTGMAPILSILHQLKATKSTRRATFYFGARHEEDLFFMEKMQEFESDLVSFEFIPSLSRPRNEADWAGRLGRVTACLSRDLAEACEREAYLCGSPKMIDSIVEVLIDKGIPEEHIYYDKFS
jgi:Na+-transporting NADH:ubiquinone oxidoreductase subunit F